ncbi:unnamed protein product [Rotaria sp. Silwood2]
MLSINNYVSLSAQKTPYKIIFDQPTRHDHEFWQELNKQYSNNLIINKENLSQSISDMISSNDDELTNNELADVSIPSPIPSLWWV